MYDSTLLEKYADLIVKVGINLQPGEGLVLSGSTEALDLLRLVTEKAYQMGAKDVIYMPLDDQMSKARFAYGPSEAFEAYDDYRAQYLINLYEDHYQHAFVPSTDPNLLKEMDPAKIAAYNRKVASINQDTGLTKYRMTGKTRWTIAAMPGTGWATLVFPDLEPDEAKKALFDLIAQAVRIDQADPVQAWQKHNDQLATVRNYLNQHQFDRIHFKGPGTDLTVGLAAGHHWLGGSKDSSVGSTDYVANMPTEEVFTTPHKDRVDGVVRSTKPLSLHGNLITDMVFTFKDGKVVDFSASNGKDVLENHLSQDEGAKRLGEIALVEDTSPISQTGKLFYNTLFDENASCHLAFGQSYGYAMKGGTDMEKDQLVAKGANQSMIHTDFMIGGADVDVTGYQKDGTALPIIVNGEYVKAITEG